MPTAVSRIGPDPRSRRRIADEFRRLLRDGARLRPAGTARQDPAAFAGRYTPRHAVSLFGSTYYLTDFRFDEGLDFFVAFVMPPTEGAARPVLYPRIFYKDVSLIWRVASHVISSEDDDWIGKGETRLIRDADGEHWVSDEDTTNLPYEIQTAFDEISRRRRRIRDEHALRLVLRNAPSSRIHPYSDFSAPRRLVNRGRPVARITRRNDPTSLRFTAGFEPDFDRLVEVESSASRLYGGTVRKYRILSTNGRVQYQFVASPTHVWINPPQTLSTELTTYGLRALYVAADDEIFVPGYDYHFIDDSVDPPALHSQIPEGFAGEPSPIDPERVDASAWIEALPVIRDFRRRCL